jgi:hypothetical protein
LLIIVDCPKSNSCEIILTSRKKLLIAFNFLHLLRAGESEVDFEKNFYDQGNIPDKKENIPLSRGIEIVK